MALLGRPVGHGPFLGVKVPVLRQYWNVHIVTLLLLRYQNHSQYDQSYLAREYEKKWDLGEVISWEKMRMNSPGLLVTGNPSAKIMLLTYCT